MDNYIIINMNLFTLNHSVYVIENGKSREAGNYSIENLPEAICIIAYAENIYKVKILGGAKYSQLIEFGIGSMEMRKYNERKIEVEVI